MRFDSSFCDCHFDLDISDNQIEIDEHEQVINKSVDLADHMNLICACGNVHNLNENVNNVLFLLVD